jgi:hypothetical protein
MKDFFAENFAKDFGNFCFRKNNVDLPPRREHFPEKFLLSGKNFWGGPWEGRGPKFWNTPPNRKPVGTAL